MPTPAELKRALRDAGLEIYRTRADVVHLAERVRENLLMDSGVYVRASALTVGIVVRAQKADFPGETEAQLLDRARALAAPAKERAYVEVGAAAHDIHDPGDPTRTLDTWFEATFERPLADEAALLDEIRFALSIEKAASPR